MNPDKMFIQNIILSLIIVGLMFDSGSSKGGIDSTQTPVSLLPSTEISQSKNNTFDYYVDTPNGWQVLKNDKTNLIFAGPISNNERFFVKPDLSIFITGIEKQSKKDKEDFSECSPS